jgi:hypothetical protein
MTVSKNGNVCDRVRIACNKRSLAELIVQNIERAVSKRPGGERSEGHPNYRAPLPGA